MAAEQYDIIIIGGGPVGMALALALHDTGISSFLLEARGLPEKIEDPRPLALSHGSHLILHRLGVWNNLTQNTPITTIHISNRGNFGQTILTSHDAGVPTLGFVVNYHDLFRSMHKKLTASKANYIAGAAVTRLETHESSGTVYFDYQGKEESVAAKLLVLADGGHLAKQLPDITYQTHDYQQWAVVANVKAEKKQTGIAYERFTIDGPVALLPHQEDFSLVWTVSPETAKEITALNDEAFLTRLHQHFGDRLGKFIAAGKRSAFPLTLKYATPITTQRIALIGNAAQTLHPVAGQGFNLGLRDAYELANEIITTKNTRNEVGTSTMLSKYRQSRQMDSSAGRIFTDSLVKLFSNESKMLRQACGLGLSTLDCMPPFKRFVARRMIFGARG
ncbi:2-octaprenyl-6-methoxyphenol hydroxylase [Nitrosomonas sp. Nm84]|uniref:FAD-dependent monooxygenase n=1 Tax=Nitrosomonas sp. Nm84 TaxID=200124 RepID=UPI000D766669|nr:FAD-dependent monooxygenase [Nitrosomonas sp. Nm84]PXW85419.1 2-octaprenyl-6-methoxyphenol hydroxylase [Nitrosomonas sp. Nm84]